MNSRELKHTLHTIIYEADTPAGKLFDVLLIVSIILSVFAVMLESIGGFKAEYGDLLFTLEWIFTVLFTIEYIVRLYSIGKPLKYAFSFFGIVDLLAILPTYISLFFPGVQYLVVVRILRVLRIFRVLKLVQYLSEAQTLVTALRSSRRKITVFLFAVATLVVILGSLMHLIEGGENGFDSIPHGVYWAIVTLTTVGYGDITPQTDAGRFLAAVVMIMGYAIIAVPTGIVTAELSRNRGTKVSTQACPACSAEGHDYDARFCKHCGVAL